MEAEGLDTIVLALAYTELIGYVAKGFLYSFSHYKKSGINLTEENVKELKRPMTYNFIRLIYRDATSRRNEESFDNTNRLNQRLYP